MDEIFHWLKYPRQDSKIEFDTGEIEDTAVVGKLSETQEANLQLVRAHLDELEWYGEHPAALLGKHR